MTTLRTQLEELGLTPNQAEVYLILSHLKEAKAGEIIKKTGLHRNLVYVALQELDTKKLVSISRVKGVALYKSLSASRLLTDIQDKERTAKNVIEELNSLAKKRNTQEIIVYEGLSEFRKHVVRSYSLEKKGGLMRYLGISPAWHEIVGPEVEKEVIQIQKERKLHHRGIAKSFFPELATYLKEIDGLGEAKINPLISSDTNNIEILTDRICIQSFVEPYSVVEIVNKEIAKNYQNYFDFIWNQKTSRPFK